MDLTTNSCTQKILETFVPHREMIHWYLQTSLKPLIALTEELCFIYCPCMVSPRKLQPLFFLLNSFIVELVSSKGYKREDTFQQFLSCDQRCKISNVLGETLGRSQFTVLRLLRLNLLQNKMVLLKVILREAWQCLLL